MSLARLLTPRVPATVLQLIPWSSAFLGDTSENLLFKNYVRFEVFTVVTMKSAVFWDIKTRLLLHRGHITSPLQSPTS
jgi:hypothetical protein